MGLFDLAYGFWTRRALALGFAMAGVACGGDGGPSHSPTTAAGSKSSGSGAIEGENGGPSAQSDGGGGTNDTKPASSGGSGGAQASGEGGKGAQASSGGGGSPPSAGGTWIDVPESDAGSTVSPVTPDAACAAESHVAEYAPLDLYMMLDTSGSMMIKAVSGSTTTKWDAERGAVSTFLTDPESSGIGVGLQFFPIARAGAPDSCQLDEDCGAFGPCRNNKVCANEGTATTCGSPADCPSGGGCETLGECKLSRRLCWTAVPCTQAGDTCELDRGECVARDTCDQGAYDTPAVEVALLPAAAPTLVAALQGHAPVGNTPTYPALSGALAHVRALASAAPSHRGAVVLATDGLPTECDPVDISSVTALVSREATATPPLRTFVIGVVSWDQPVDEKTNLEKLAQAGGSSGAFVVEGDIAKGFLDALNAIRSAALPCEYAIPRPTEGEGDLHKVNVRFTSGAGVATTIDYVATQANCQASGRGWYYDVDPEAGQTPSRITVCDTTCSELKSDTASKVDILLGCTTRDYNPR